MPSLRFLPPIAGSLAAAALWALAAGCGGAAEAERGEHLILVVVDTLRADALGCYGAEAEASPTIDGLAARGTLFESAQTPSTWTVPATVSLLSGYTPLEHGATPRLFRSVPDDVPLLAEALRDAEFRTCAVVCNPLLTPETSFDRGFERYTHQKFGAADAAIDEAVAWLESTAPGGERLFLYLHLFDPHWPYEPAAPEAERFEVPPSPLDEAEQIAAAQGMMAGDAEATRAILEWSVWAHEAYGACVASTDREVGRLFGELERLELLGDSVVVVTSDHGEEFGEHGAIGHARQLHEETLHVPLIVAGPGVPAGRRVTDPAPLRCLPTTVLRRLGLRPMSARHGADLFDDEDRAVVAEEDQVAVLTNGLWPNGDGTFRRVRNLLGLRRGDRRLLWAFGEDFDDGVGRLVPLDGGVHEGEAMPVDAEPAGAALLGALRASWEDAREASTLEGDASVSKRRDELDELGYFGGDDEDG